MEAYLLSLVAISVLVVLNWLLMYMLCLYVDCIATTCSSLSVRHSDCVTTIKTIHHVHHSV